MTPKEVVLRAIERRDPPRLPLIYCNRDFASSDVLSTGACTAAGFAPAQPGMTEWGYLWHSLDGTMGQPEAHPLADERRIAGYQSPDAGAPGRFNHVQTWCAEHADNALRFSIGISGFNQATFLRGFDALLTDLYEDPARARQVLDYVFAYENGLIERAVHYPVDIIAFGDDWGTQQDLIISPVKWREVFRPYYAEQFDSIHRAGKKVWFHSCGQIARIIPDLIDIGVDVLELLQPDVFGIERLAREFGGKVCFCCSVDHQRLASTGTREEICSYVQRLVETLGAFNGGYIGYIEDYASLGMSEQNYQWIREAFHQYA